MAISLNIPQERELARLIDYERSTCSVEGELVYRCAFPYRPDDELQAELIDAGALAAKAEGKRGTIVVITSDGYSFFLERNRAERERVRRATRGSSACRPCSPRSAWWPAFCWDASWRKGRGGLPDGRAAHRAAPS